MAESNKDSEFFKKLSMHIRLRDGIVNLYGSSASINTTHYQTEVQGRIIHEFTDEHTLSRAYMFSYYTTAVIFIRHELKRIGVSSEGLGKEAAWNISWTEIKENK